jgi:cytoskeletal protein CcmA (bactofilin family)
MVDNKDNDLLDLDEEDYDTVLAPDIDFTGTIQFEEPFMIKGHVSGHIDATSDLMVDSGAQVKADIKASRVIIKGEVIGDVTATQMVHVFSSGKLTGDVTAPEVVLDSGCFFSGICTMTR